MYGTTALKQLHGPGNSTFYDPSWECFVDDRSIGSTQPIPYPENNWVLCDTSDLAVARDGDHILIVNVTTMGTTFWFDYLEFDVPSYVTYGDSVLSVSSVDPGIEYGAGWGPLGNTANYTTNFGAQAAFNFTGMYASMPLLYIS